MDFTVLDSTSLTRSLKILKRFRCWWNKDLISPLLSASQEHLMWEKELFLAFSCTKYYHCLSIGICELWKWEDNKSLVNFGYGNNSVLGLVSGHWHRLACKYNNSSILCFWRLSQLRCCLNSTNININFKFIFNLLLFPATLNNFIYQKSYFSSYYLILSVSQILCTMPCFYLEDILIILFQTWFTISLFNYWNTSILFQHDYFILS